MNLKTDQMPGLARKIAQAKWNCGEGFSEGEIPADALGDLRTNANSLSFWRCPTSSVEELKEVVLAIATSADRSDKFDIAWLEETLLSDVGLNTISTKGETKVATLRERHVDITLLDYVRLGKLASLFMRAIISKQCMRLSKKQVIEIIKEAVKNKRISLEILKEKVRADVEKALASP